MGFSTGRYEQEKKQQKWDVHPVWRGIGCVMVPLIMMISYLAAGEIMTANTTEGWFRIPIELSGPAQYPYLYAQIVLSVAILLLIVMIIMVVYAVVFRVAGPPRYGPTDAPPPKKRPRRRKY